MHPGTDTDILFQLLDIIEGFNEKVWDKFTKEGVPCIPSKEITLPELRPDSYPPGDWILDVAEKMREVFKVTFSQDDLLDFSEEETSLKKIVEMIEEKIRARRNST